MVELSDFNWVPRMARYFEQMKTVSLPDEDGGWVEQPREDYEVPALTLASLPGFGGGGVCIPHVLVGIRAETENSAFATGFVRCIYNTEVQRYYLHQNNGGLPVVTALLGELENNARAAGIVYMDWVDDTSESRELAYPEGAHVSEVLTGVRQAYIPDVLLEQSLYNNVL